MKKIKILLPFLIVGMLNSYSQVGAGDCPGLCVTTGNTYAAVNGTSQELNATNRGCLTANEATSSFWYQICFNTNGLFYFNINPQGNNNDFDFAIWNGSNCPPTNNPIRCSFAGIFPFGGATNDLTGLGNGAIDLSEGAGGNGWLAPINVVNGQCLTININNYGNGSNNFTLSFAGTTATIYCPNNPLPVELLYFNGVFNIDAIFLDWATASEINSDHFDIEKMTTTGNVEVIGRVNSTGNSNVINQYQFIDENVLSGYNYYRLVEYSFDGIPKQYNWISIFVEFEDYCCDLWYNVYGQVVNINDCQSGMYYGITKNQKIIKILK